MEWVCVYIVHVQYMYVRDMIVCVRYSTCMFVSVHVLCACFVRMLVRVHVCGYLYVSVVCMHVHMREH